MDDAVLERSVALERLEADSLESPLLRDFRDEQRADLHVLHERTGRKQGVAIASRIPGSVVSSTVFPRGGGRGVVLIDNYDSFTINLAHRIAERGVDVAVVRNDETTVEEVLAARPAGVVISPGPRSPREAGISVPLVVACAGATPPIPLLGVCLGHQAIGVAFGGRVVRALAPVHGRATAIRHGNVGVLFGLPNPFLAARYHSLVIDSDALPAEFLVHARSREGEIMGVLHRRLPIEGVQFHPESFLTPQGPRMIEAFLRRCGLRLRPAGVASPGTGRTRRRVVGLPRGR
jgi:anthranilate synthase component 2